MPDARNLYDLKYITVVRLEQATDDSTCYVARHPELEGAIGQGDTPEQAEADLEEATRMVLDHLIANHLPVPSPMTLGGDFAVTASGELPAQMVRMVAPFAMAHTIMPE